MMKFALCLAVVVSAAWAQTVPALKDVFQGKFVVGAAVNEGQFTERNAGEAALAKQQFNSITPENVCKWESIHPQPDRFNWGPADAYVEFGQKNKMVVIGHTLVWHSQTPKWVFEDKDGKPVTREVLLSRMQEHISRVVGRYKGKIRGWDVVNEALNEDGTMRPTPWFKIIGEDYLLKAFEYAHEADPAAELYYNDYSLENPAKLKGALELVKKLKAGGAHITGVGTQTHGNLEFPSAEQAENTIVELGKLGMKVMITELDITVLPSRRPGTSADVAQRAEADPALNPYAAGLPDEIQQKLAKRYADLFAVYVKHAGVVQRVTFWGVTDRASWLNNWPIRGRTNYPLLFDREGKPKPAFQAVIGQAKM